MTDHPTDKNADPLAKALKARPDPELEDQGDIAADDAGATALAERVSDTAGVRGRPDGA